MWPTARVGERDMSNAERFSCDANPIGPIANNPDPTAVKLTIEFERFTNPVVFPNDIPTHVVKTRYVSSCKLLIFIQLLYIGVYLPVATKEVSVAFLR